MDDDRDEDEEEEGEDDDNDIIKCWNLMIWISNKSSKFKWKIKSLKWKLKYTLKKKQRENQKLSIVHFVVEGRCNSKQEISISAIKY